MSNLAPVTANPIHPLPVDRWTQLLRLTEGLDAHQLWWLAGYASAAATAKASVASNHATIATTSTNASSVTEEFQATVLYGSQTGNSAKLATQLHQSLSAQNIPTRLIRADQYSLKQLKDERLLYVLISTQGDGDPPEDARAFIEQLGSKRAPKLKQLQFAVLGLGDSSYPKFCEVGKQIDARLTELGAVRLFERADVDVEIDPVAKPWLEKAQVQARQLHQQSTQSSPKSSTKNLSNNVAVLPVRLQHVQASVIANQRITTAQSVKDVRHIELSLEGTGLHYQPGDALAVIVSNPSITVDAIISQLAISPEHEVQLDGKRLSLRQALLERREITRVQKPLVQLLAQSSRDVELTQLLEPAQGAALNALLQSLQLVDWLARFRAKPDAQALVDSLRALKPRQYSIASAQSLVGEEVHLTVAHVSYENEFGSRFGAASHHLANRKVDDLLSISVEANERFRLPVDDARPIIMIGPGTGVAPFRAFLQERVERGATGKNWLFFGNTQFRHDFLYQLEWQQWLARKQLHRLDVAFSRDGAEKVYVQDRMRQQSRELYRWLEEGASLYLCGDATRMAKDVDRCLREIVAQEAGVDNDAASQYVLELIENGRYQRDVY